MDNVQLKLVGAETFVCKPLGIHNPVHKGGTVTVTPEAAEYLESLSYQDSANNEHPVWTTNLNAKPTHNARAVTRTLEQHVKDDRAERAVASVKAAEAAKQPSAKATVDKPKRQRASKAKE